MHKYEFTFDSNEWPFGGIINNDILHQRGDTLEGAQEKLIESLEERGVKPGNIVSVKKIS